MVGNKVVASVCSALVAASLLELQADVVLPTHEGDLMMGPAHSGVQCIDGVCIPARVTNGFYPTRWRKWPIEPPAAAPRGMREGVSPPNVDVPGPSDEAQIPGRAGQPEGEPRRTPASDETNGPRRRPSEPSTSPTLPVEPREPAMPPELDEIPTRPEGGRSPQFPRDGRLPRRTPTMATRSIARQASLIDTLRSEAADENDEVEDLALPSVRVEPKTVSSTADNIDPSAATPDPTPWHGTRPARSSKPVDLRAPAEQPRAGSAFRSASVDAGVGVRYASANMDPNDNRIARASAGTLAMRPTIKDTWESELVPANPLRSRETGDSTGYQVMQASATSGDTASATMNDANVSKVHTEPASDHSLAFRNPLRR